MKITMCDVSNHYHIFTLFIYHIFFVIRGFPQYYQSSASSVILFIPTYNSLDTASNKLQFKKVFPPFP